MPDCPSVCTDITPERAEKKLIVHHQIVMITIIVWCVRFELSMDKY